MKYLVVGAQSEEYNINGEIIKSGFIQMLNLENTNDGVIKGYQPVRINLNNSALRVTDFKDAPGIYEIEFNRVPITKGKNSQQYGKGKPKGMKKIPFKADLLKAVKFPAREELLVFGGRQNKLESWKGMSVYLMDTNTPLMAETEKGKAYGLYIMEEAFENWTFQQLQFLPGWYEAEYKSVRNEKGEEEERVDDITPIEAFTIQELAT